MAWGQAWAGDLIALSITAGLQHEIAGFQAADTGKTNDAFRIMVGIRIQEDPRLGARDLIPDLSCRRELPFADESEGLVSAAQSVGVDPRQIQMIPGAATEIAHEVRAAQGGIDSADGLPAEHVGLRSAGQPVLPGASEDGVPTGIAVEPVIARMAGEAVAAGSATKHVVTRGAFQNIVERTAPYALDTGKPVAGGIAASLRPFQEVYDHAPWRIAVIGIIESAAARQEIGARSAS